MRKFLMDARSAFVPDFASTLPMPSTMHPSFHRSEETILGTFPNSQAICIPLCLLDKPAPYSHTHVNLGKEQSQDQ